MAQKFSKGLVPFILWAGALVHPMQRVHENAPEDQGSDGISGGRTDLSAFPPCSYSLAPHLGACHGDEKAEEKQI